MQGEWESEKVSGETRKVDKIILTCGAGPLDKYVRKPGDKSDEATTGSSVTQGKAGQ